jgi:DNA-binding transcriptional regulator YbjK
MDLQAVMARRDKIVACFDELIKEKGEKAVLHRKSVKTAMEPLWLQGWRLRVITIPR